MATINAIVTYVRTGDIGLALKGFAIGVALSALGAYAAGGPVGSAAAANVTSGMVAARVALAGYSGYGVYEGVQSGNVGLAVLSGAFAALSIYGLYESVQAHRTYAAGQVEPDTTAPVGSGGESSPASEVQTVSSGSVNPQIVGPSGPPMAQAVDAFLTNSPIPDELLDRLSLEEIFRIAEARVRLAWERAGVDALKRLHANQLERQLKFAKFSIRAAFGAPSFEGAMLASGRVGKTLKEILVKLAEVDVYRSTPSASNLSTDVLKTGIDLVRGVAQARVP